MLNILLGIGHMVAPDHGRVVEIEENHFFV
jgi:hypothetical protein